MPLFIREKDAEEEEEEKDEEEGGEDEWEEDEKEGGAALAAEAGAEAGVEAESAPTAPSTPPQPAPPGAPAGGDSGQGQGAASSLGPAADQGDGPEVEGRGAVDASKPQAAGETDEGCEAVVEQEEEGEEGEQSPSPTGEPEPWEWTDLHPDMEQVRAPSRPFPTPLRPALTLWGPPPRQYVVRWEPPVLKRMHGLVRRFLVQQAAGYVVRGGTAVPALPSAIPAPRPLLTAPTGTGCWGVEDHRRFFAACRLHVAGYPHPGGQRHRQPVRGGAGPGL